MTMCLPSFLNVPSPPAMWKRWRRHVSSEVIRLRVHRIFDHSKFLSKTLSYHNNNSLSKRGDTNVIDRDKLHLEKLLGEGSFAQVFEVVFSDDFVGNNKGNDNDDDDTDNDSSDKMVLTGTAESAEKKDLSPQSHTNPTISATAAAVVVAAGTGTEKSPSQQFVIKQLHPAILDYRKTNVKDLEQAATDMIMEVAYLSRFKGNPNIVNVLGVSPSIHQCMFFDSRKNKKRHAFDRTIESESMLDYFFVMKRIPETLDRRIQSWKEQLQGKQTNRKAMLPRQCQIALQLASVLNFLQQRRIIYRDLTPRNCGIQQPGDTVQLFDFGTCRELPPAHTCDRGKPLHAKEFRNYHFYNNNQYEEVFHMSFIGTQRYMAPEIITSQLYNGKCDVYSWAIVVAELLSLEEPFGGYSQSEYIQKVVLQQERPALAALNLPHSLEELLRHAWATDLLTRPNIRQVLGHMELIVQNEVGGVAPE